MHRYVRGLIGLVLGLGVGLVLTAVVVFAKVGFLVNSPRAAHPVVLVLLFLVQAARRRAAASIGSTTE